ncbi:MAG: hypothetical protein IPJ61_03170 [Tessaracoccus sp.]|uniref:hypothetical protein n=1 Tax=Tessaracoccus sp. TaxID=1971211 RepID=UPI001EB0E187|nr:hypothetical protein [Tessaracoccus sp.]MBK7820088.1 hypothetical protein [Tessaracoccus sp.]
MRDDDRPTVRGLARNLVVGALAATVVVLFGRLTQLDVAPIPAVVLGLLAGACLWLVGWVVEPAGHPRWVQPQPPAELSRLAPDARTRRLVALLDHAGPGRGFESSALARLLGQVASERLARRHGLPADEPLAHADAVLSPRLLSYLRAERPPAIKRSTLHAYLKEIDEL